MTTAAPDAGIPPMTYVTQGKIKIKFGTPKNLTITPASDYCVKHNIKDNTRVYTVFIQSNGSCSCKCFRDTHEFVVPLSILRYIVPHAFDQTLLQITINDRNEIIEIQVPA